MAIDYEHLSGSPTIYYGTVDATATTVGTTPASGTWTKLGKAGPQNYEEAGVTMGFAQEIFRSRSAGTTAAKRAIRSSETHTVSLTLLDYRLAMQARIFNKATVTDDAVNDTYKFSYFQGRDVEEFALQLWWENNSPYASGNTKDMIRYIPRAFVLEIGDIVHSKNAFAGIPVTFELLHSTTNGLGYLIAQY